MTRYYDPVTHRFLNADGSFQAGGGLLDANMNAYCANNPVSNIDPNGTCYIKGKWMVMGHVPGADYYCYKCGGCDPAVYPNAPKGSSSKPDKSADGGIKKYPDHGDPNSRFNGKDGGWRDYNENGDPKYDYHPDDHGYPKHHPHGVLNPNGEHMHEWGWNEKGNWAPGQGRPWQGNEEDTLKRSDNANAWDNNIFKDSWSFNFSFNPPMGDMPIWERAWEDLKHLFS